MNSKPPGEPPFLHEMNIKGLLYISTTFVPDRLAFCAFAYSERCFRALSPI